MCNVEGPPPKKQRKQLMPSGEPIPVYLDYNATTPLSASAWTAMCGAQHVFGNPSSVHPFGLESKFVVDEARTKVGDALNAANPLEEILFTSGGTEANNLALIGVALAQRAKDPARRLIITTNFEHPAVEKVLTHLETAPYDFIIVRCPVNTRGLITTTALHSCIMEAVKEHTLSTGSRVDVALVSIMHANNEIGIVQDIPALAKMVKLNCPGACFHTDAAQSLGKVPVDVQKFGVDLLSVCSHKFYGPKGVGALYVKEGTPLQRITFGADHERGLRPGTENILLNVGMAAALEDAVKNLDSFAEHCRTCRSVLYDSMKEVLAKKGMKMLVNGGEEEAEGERTAGCTGPRPSFENCLPNTLSVAIVRPPDGTLGNSGEETYISAARLITELGHIVAMSAGSACHSTSDDPNEPVHVSSTLTAIGCSQYRAMGTLRLSTGKGSTEADMRRVGRFIATRAQQQLTDW